MATLTELKKALTTTGGGDGLLPYDLDQTLHDELIKLQPLAQLLDIIQAEGKTHEFRVRSAHPQAWFEGEETGASVQSGSYIRKTVQLKIQRIWGSVTGFAQKVDEKFINALAEEINGSIQGVADLMEYGVLFGTADDQSFTGDAYQYSGILPIIYKNAVGNVIDGGGVKVTLDMMDAALAKARVYRQLRNDPYLWMLGTRMKQVVDGLQTKVQLPLQSVSLADGKIVMAGYAGAPLLESEYLVPADTSTSPATTGVVAAGGSLADGTYTYKISSVTMYGEQVAGTASANVVAATTNHTANLSWTADANAKLYMIWRNVAAGVFGLVDIINAKTYDAAGLVNGNRTTYSDDGTKTFISGVKPLATGEQIITLLNINPARGAAFAGMVDDMGNQIDRLISFVELARTKDSYDYFLKGYMTLRNVYANVHSVIRHVKTA